jgi:DNA repair exonuclease SbcCD ATPase subunit
MATQGGEDEGLSKFRELVSALTRAVNSMQEHNETLDTESSNLSDLEDTAEDTLGDVEEKLEEGKDDLESAHDEAVEEIDDLVGVARAGVTDTLADAVEAIDGAEERFNGAAQSAADELDEGHSALSEEGFAGLSSDLDVVEQALKQASTDMDGAGNTFEQAAQADASEVERELDEAEAKVVTATAETQRELQEVEAQAREDGQSFDDMGTAFASACETVFGEIDSSYDELDADVQDDAKGLVESIRKSVQDEAGEIEDAIGTHMKEPCETAVEVDAPVFLAQVEVAEAAVQGVIATGEDMKKTVDNLLVCQDVCDVIKDVLESV